VQSPQNVPAVITQVTTARINIILSVQQAFANFQSHYELE